MSHPQFKEMKQCYGFDEVALVPGDTTINPEQVNIDFKIGNCTFQIPILASAIAQSNTAATIRSNLNIKLLPITKK